MLCLGKFLNVWDLYENIGISIFDGKINIKYFFGWKEGLCKILENWDLKCVWVCVCVL